MFVAPIMGLYEHILHFLNDLFVAPVVGLYEHRRLHFLLALFALLLLPILVATIEALDDLRRLIQFPLLSVYANKYT